MGDPLTDLWRGIEKVPLARFDPRVVDGLPVAAARYLLHALAPGAPLANAVHLRMRGDIKLDGRWWPFAAEQVVHWERGFVWKAKARVRGLPVVGFDRLLDGEAEMRWKLLGLFPVMTASGPDVARSAAGRMAGEALWLPGVFLRDGVGFAEEGDELVVEVAAHGAKTRVHLGLSARGSVSTFRYLRWGDPDKQGFREVPFGGRVENERTIDGVTFPSKLRIGWYFGAEDETSHSEPTRFDREGEFFRCELEDLEYR